MANIKPSDHGIVVDHKESGVRFAVSDANHDQKSERKVRDLKPGESVLSYVPKLAPTRDEPDEDDDRTDSEREADRQAELAREELAAQAARDAEASAAPKTPAPTPGAPGTTK